MNDSNELKARSIELAERAFRFRDRAEGEATKERLHSVGNQLIMIKDINRFYIAQSELESKNFWPEEYRSLAHELNVADRSLRNLDSMDLNTIFDILKQWANQYISSRDQTAIRIGNALLSHIEIYETTDELDAQKSALNYIMSVIEALLEHITMQDDKGHVVSEITLMFRAMRDGILVARILTYDENNLLDAYEDEGETVDALTVARHTLDELYQTTSSINS